jgi:uncharacterized protein
MSDIQLTLDGNGKGSFYLEENGERLAEMVISVTDNNLTVFHTEVSDKLKGQGIAGKMLEKMVDYARSHKLKVIPLCAYVSAQFKRHPEKYEDVWNKHWHSKSH